MVYKQCRQANVLSLSSQWTLRLMRAIARDICVSYKTIEQRIMCWRKKIEREPLIHFACMLKGNSRCFIINSDAIEYGKATRAQLSTWHVQRLLAKKIDRIHLCYEHSTSQRTKLAWVSKSFRIFVDSWMQIVPLIKLSKKKRVSLMSLMVDHPMKLRNYILYEIKVIEK